MSLGVAPTIEPVPQGALMRFPTPIDYSSTWALQQRLHAERLADRCPDTFLLLEHHPVFTAGRQTLPEHMPGVSPRSLSSAIGLQRVNRGGSITYHGPGQLVGYPILKLNRVASGPKAYVRLLEDIVIATVKQWGIEGRRQDGTPGVWIHAADGFAKIASIGVRVDHGVTLHGFALNVDLDLAPFSSIVPCGLADSRTTSMAQLVRSPIELTAVAEQIVTHSSRLLHVDWIRQPMNVLGDDVPIWTPLALSQEAG